jgi:hypothetical protein
VLGNDRIDVSSKVLSKLYPQSDIEQYFGDVDPVTGEVNVKNDHPISSGYVADAERIPSSSKADNQTMRDVLGVDGAATFYRKYLNDNDPLFEVLFRVNVELEVPLPQTEAPGIPLGGMDPTTHHLAGTGITKGGVPEGKLPGRVPIEILDIKSVGTPRTAFPSRGAKSAWSGTPELASDRGPPSAFLPSPSGHGIEEPHRDEE